MSHRVIVRTSFFRVLYDKLFIVIMNILLAFEFLRMIYSYDPQTFFLTEHQCKRYHYKIRIFAQIIVKIVRE